MFEASVVCTWLLSAIEIKEQLLWERNFKGILPTVRIQELNNIKEPESSELFMQIMHKTSFLFLGHLLGFNASMHDDDDTYIVALYFHCVLSN